MKTIGALSVCAGVFLFLCAASCDHENLTSTDETTSASPAVRPAIAIASKEDFVAAWNGGAFSDNTTFSIAANTTLDWTDNTSFTATNKSFTLDGVDSTSVIKKTHNGPGTGLPLFNVHNDGEDGEDNVTISDLKLVRTGDEGFFEISEYSNVLVTNVIMDIEDNSFIVQCNTLNVDGLTMRAQLTSGFLHRSRDDQAFSHTIQNSRFHRKVNGSGPCTASIINPTDGSVTWTNNVFSATSASDGQYFYNVRVLDAQAAIDFILSDNDFRKQTIVFNQNCLDSDVNLTLSGNNSNLVFCGDGEDLIECMTCDDDPPTTYNFDLTIALNAWSFMGDPLDYDDFGPVSGQNACYDVTDTVYVEFALPTTTDFEPYEDILVEWGDDNCTSGGGTVGAEWNASTSKWNASFDVSGVPDEDIYWRAKGTLCSKTVVGDCIRRRFTLCGAGGVPVWFTQE